MMPGPLLLFGSPVRYFEERLARELSLGLILTSLLLWVLSATSAGVTLLWRAQSALGEPGLPAAVGIGLTLFSACASLSLTFWLSTGALVMLDTVFSGSGKARRIVELSAIACWPHIPWGIVGSVAVWLWFHPEPVGMVPETATTGEMRRLAASYREYMASTPFMRTYSLLGAFVSLWVVCLQACVLRVVSGFSVGGAWAAGMMIGSVFVGAPWAIQRF